MKDTNSFLQRLLGISIVRFGMVGVVSTLGDLTVLSILDRLGANYHLSVTLGFLTGLTIGFILNGKYVFQKDHTVARYVKYGLISAGGLGITNLIIDELKDRHSWTLFAAKLVAVFVVFFWNYTWSKLWAFK